MRLFLGIFFTLKVVILYTVYNVEGTISVISEDTGSVVAIIEERNIRSMSDALEGYVINSNPLNVCEIPDPPPNPDPPQNEFRRNGSSSQASTRKWILLGVIYDCDLTAKARNAQQSGYSGLIIQNIGTNNSHLVPWQIMRFPLAKINHVVVGEYDGFLLRYNYSYPENSFYIKFEEDHFYQVLCYVLAGIILLLLSTMFLLFWFQICCTIIAMRLHHRLGQRVQRWLHPSKRRLTRPMLNLLPVKNWVPSDPFQVCAVCQEDFLEEDKIRVLPCSHAFHSVCIDPWLLKRSRRCPNCMQRVRLPNQNDDEEDASYSSHRAHNRSHHRRRCSQVSHRDHPNAANDSAPLIDLPESPKIRIITQEPPLGGEDPNCEIITTVNEETTSNASNSTSTRDWQLKRFLQNFNYVPSEGSCSCSVSNSGQLPERAVIKECGQKSSDIPLHPMKLEEENLLETCLDIPSTFLKNDIEEVPLTVDISPEDLLEGGQEFPNSLSVLPREYSNPGYVSFDDDDNDDSLDATEEQNISSSFDATTISESLPRDESIIVSNRLDYDNDDYISEIPQDQDCNKSELSLSIEIIKGEGCVDQV